MNINITVFAKSTLIYTSVHVSWLEKKNLSFIVGVAEWESAIPFYFSIQG